MTSNRKTPIEIVSDFFSANKIQRGQVSDAVACPKTPGQLKITLVSSSIFGPVPQHTLDLGDAGRAREAQLAIRKGDVNYHKPVPVTPGW